MPWFDVCAVVILLLILYSLLYRRRSGLLQNVVFRVAYCGVLAATAADLAVACADRVPAELLFGPSLSQDGLLLFLTTLYFFTHLAAYVALVCYIHIVMGLSPVERPTQQLLLFAPLAVWALALGTNVFTGSFFSFSGEGSFVPGPLLLAGGMGVGYYMAYAAGMLARHGRRNAPPDRVAAICAFVVLTLAAHAVQLVFPDLRAVGFADAMSLLLLYLAVEGQGGSIDPQTGLQNADAFYFFADANGSRRVACEFVQVTVDNVRALDGELGTAVMGELLAEVALFLRRLSRLVNVYRLDRGVFMLAFKGTDELDVDRICTAVVNRFREPFVSGRYSITLEACCCRMSGGTDFTDTDSLRLLVQLAADGEAHRHRERVYASELDVAAGRRRLLLDRQLRTLLEDGVLRLLYQPVYSVRDSRCTSLEVSATISTPELGIVPDRQFIPPAEANGTMQRIFHFFLHTVCAFIKEARLEERGFTSVEFVLPLSELRRSTISDVIADIADIYFIPRSFITLILMGEVLDAWGGRVEGSLARLREKGFGLVLDDYGHGYTNAAQVQRMRLRAVNLDRHLTQSAFISNKRDTVLLATVELLKRLGLGIKARYIESAAQRDYAVELGCDRLQGYFFCAPLSAPELVEFLEEGGNG